MTLSFTIPTNVDLPYVGVTVPTVELVAAGLVSLAFCLTVAAIWTGRRRSRRPRAARAPLLQVPALALATGDTTLKAFRKSGAMQSVKVTTPVSKVAVKALSKVGADPKSIAKTTGLSRDAVAMMMAQSGRDTKTNLKPVAAAEPRQTAPRTQVAPAAGARRNGAAERGMIAPGAGAVDLRTRPATLASPVGSRLDARLR